MKRRSIFVTPGSKGLQSDSCDALAAVVPVPLDLGAVVLLDVLPAGQLGGDEDADGGEGHARGRAQVEARLLGLGPVGERGPDGGRGEDHEKYEALHDVPDLRPPGAAVGHCTLRAGEHPAQRDPPAPGRFGGIEGASPGRAARRRPRPRGRSKTRSATRRSRGSLDLAGETGDAARDGLARAIGAVDPGAPPLRRGTRRLAPRRRGQRPLPIVGGRAPRGHAARAAGVHRLAARDLRAVDERAERRASSPRRSRAPWPSRASSR